jgi:exodeoxyribonuclease VII large subunit
MKSTVLTVQQLNDYVRTLLSRDPLLQKLHVRGEISNFKVHTSGHMYFSLKDRQDRIQCVMFKQNAQNLKFLPKDGMEVIVTGRVSIYTRDGLYQLYVDDMEQSGLGALHLAFEELKKKLREEGLFDDTHKKPLPLLPQKIAVITSHAGAAVRDIIRVIHNRNSHVDILIVPVAVQGEGAARQIARAIDYVNTRADIDLIITGRGGGSIEELWAFNEEIVARAIYNSSIPVITAIGHETDFTIADFVADVRAATPSNAAELAVPEASYMQSFIDSLKNYLLNAIMENINEKQHRLNIIRNHYAFQSPCVLVEQQSQYFDQLSQRFYSAFQHIIQQKSDRLSKAISNLETLSPLKVLSRGYVIVTPEGDTEPISSIEAISLGQQLDLLFIDGQAVCKVESIESDNNNYKFNVKGSNPNEKSQ